MAVKDPVTMQPDPLPDSALTPLQKLDRSRHALLVHLQGGEAAVRPRADRVDPRPADWLDDPRVDVDEAALPHYGEPERRASSIERLRHYADSVPWASLGRRVVTRWWQRHPANAAAQLARPFLDKYAQREPAKLMAIAAAAGSAIVILKPWRLLSATALLAATLKTSDVAALVTTLLQKDSTPEKESP